jgi:hypothetical protein
MHVRKILTFVDESRSEAGQPAQIPLRKVAAVAVVKNPFAGKFEQNLSSLVEASDAVGREITAIALELLRPYAAESYGKGAIVGLSGEQEHGVAMLTTVFGNVMREAAGGGKAWISSMTKRAGPGAGIDIPLALPLRRHQPDASGRAASGRDRHHLRLRQSRTTQQPCRRPVEGQDQGRRRARLSAATADLIRGSHDGYLQDRSRAHQVAARRPCRLYRR